MILKDMNKNYMGHNKTQKAQNVAVQSMLGEYSMCISNENDIHQFSYKFHVEL